MMASRDGPTLDRAQEMGADAEQFAQAWREFVLAVRRSQARSQTSRDDLTLAQYYFLAQLRDEGSLPVCRLAEAAGVAAPTATRLVDALERAGLVQRARSQTDRRTVLVSLTGPGREQVRRKHAQIARRRRLVYERLEPEERRRGARLLHHLAEIVDQL